MRRTLFFIVAIVSSAAAAVPPPPPVIEPYIREGRFDPGDYGWMRGRFEDATPTQKAEFAAVRAWIDACFEAGREENRASLRAMGVAEPKLERMDFRDGLCASVAHMPTQIEVSSFATFQQSAAVATPVADTYLMAVAVAERVAGPRGPGLAETLLARPVGEQMLRIGLGWGEGDLGDAPKLPPEAKAIVIARLGAALVQRDRANTRWLKTLVEKQGWPKISQVGEAASAQAWLLVQHADADPAFQLRALRLMEPLLATGEVSRRNHAYLYDRVMLKIEGRQRYGTQAMCRKGSRLPQPLEDEAAIYRLRAEAGLEPLADYMQQLQAAYGDCPPDSPPPAPVKRAR